jgi:hypothetical protein
MKWILAILNFAGYGAAAYHAWDGLISYDQFWRWTIALILVVGGWNGLIDELREPTNDSNDQKPEGK